MPNTLLTADMITRESLRILHQKSNFIGRINREYDSSYAQSGAKIGSSLRIRQPNQYTVRTGAALSANDTVESSVTLNVTNQKGVDVNFTTEELSMDIDDFSSRIVEPAMAVLSANIEADALSMYKDVANQVNNVGSATTYLNVLNARKNLVDNLTPMDNSVTCTLNTQANVDLVDALKGLFNDRSELSKQFSNGVIGRGQGFSYFENTLLGNFTSGTDNSAYLVNGGTQTGAALTVDTGTGTLVAGDVVTIAGVNRVHPETKDDTGSLQQFVITANAAGGATSLAISPSIVTSGAKQNVSASPADNAAITKVGGVSASYGVSLAYHKDAFTFATADLILPNGVDMGSRQSYDGISMRMVRDYDINNDKLPARLDVLYGYKTIRPELACRIATN